MIPIQEVILILPDSLDHESYELVFGFRVGVTRSVHMLSPSISAGGSESSLQDAYSALRIL